MTARTVVLPDPGASVTKHDCITQAEWREWAKTATRNFTDRAIGQETAGKRANDAANSAVAPPNRRAKDTDL